MKGLMNIGLPEHKSKDFEDFLLRAIDFETGKPLSPARDRSVDYYIEQGDEKYFFSYYKDALKCYALALKKEPGTIQAWAGQIRCLLDLGLYASALYWAERSLNLCRDNTLLECLTALCLSFTGNDKKAEEIINRPVKESDSAMVWLIRGETLIKFKRHSFLFPRRHNIGPLGAFFSFLKALEPDPKDGLINQRIGIAYLRQNYLMRAFEHLRLALIAAPQNPLTLYHLAEYYRRKKNYRYARFYVKKSIAFNLHLDSAIELLQILSSPIVKFKEKLGLVFL